MCGPLFSMVRTARPAFGVGGDADVSADGVVVDGVVEEVGDEAFDEARVARAWRRLEGQLEMEAVTLEFGRVAVEDSVVGEGCEVEGLVSIEAAFAAGEGEQRVGQLLLLAG